jgi:KDO2-lipid IV(A) lauroyltransferase
MLRLVRWLSAWPLWMLHALGSALGWLSWALSPSYRRRFADNARRGGATPAQARQAVAQAGRLVAELPHLWLRPADRPMQPPPQWQGTEHIEAALAAGRGLVVLTPHLGAFEVVAQAYAERFGARQPMTALYRPARKAWLRQLEETARARPGLLTAPASLAGVRQMMRALRQGQTVGMLPDQVPPDGMGVWAPFFGREAYTMTLASRLVLQTGAVPLLVLCERLSRGRGYAVRALPLPEPLPAATPGGDEAVHQRACAVVMNRAMEHAVGLMPQQYLWGYDRYKAPRGGAAGPAGGG